MTRKTLLINPKFQLQYMGWSATMAVITMIIFQLAHLWFFRNLKEMAVQAGVPPQHFFFQFIRDRQSEMNWITCITCVLVFVVISVIGLVLSHRIAGPMYRLKKHFETIADSGVHTPVQFREGDYFQEVATAYNLQFDKDSKS